MVFVGYRIGRFCMFNDCCMVTWWNPLPFSWVWSFDRHFRLLGIVQAVENGLPFGKLRQRWQVYEHIMFLVILPERHGLYTIIRGHWKVPIIRPTVWVLYHPNTEHFFKFKNNIIESSQQKRWKHIHRFSQNKLKHPIFSYFCWPNCPWFFLSKALRSHLVLDLDLQCPRTPLSHPDVAWGRPGCW